MNVLVIIAQYWTFKILDPWMLEQYWWPWTCSYMRVWCIKCVSICHRQRKWRGESGGVPSDDTPETFLTHRSKKCSNRCIFFGLKIAQRSHWNKFQSSKMKKNLFIKSFFQFCPVFPHWENPVLHTVRGSGKYTGALLHKYNHHHYHSHCHAIIIFMIIMKVSPVVYLTHTTSGTAAVTAFKQYFVNIPYWRESCLLWIFSLNTR